MKRYVQYSSIVVTNFRYLIAFQYDTHHIHHSTNKIIFNQKPTSILNIKTNFLLQNEMTDKVKTYLIVKPISNIPRSAQNSKYYYIIINSNDTLTI